eukprot:Pgem_evm1s6209
MKVKPRGIGALIKDPCCGITMIVIIMELVENETIQENKEFAKERGSAIATTLRLAKPYYGTGITLCAVS